jgi:hypothetical protein
MATEADSTNTGVVATIVIVGSFALIAISAMLTAMARTEKIELEKSRPTHADLQTVAALDTTQLAALTAAPRWIDKASGKLAIPIDVAMRAVVEEFRKNPQAASPPPPPGVVLTPPAPAGPSDPSAVVHAPAASPPQGAPSGAVSGSP